MKLFVKGFYFFVIFGAMLGLVAMPVEARVDNTRVPVVSVGSVVLLITDNVNICTPYL